VKNSMPTKNLHYLEGFFIFSLKFQE